MKKAVMLLVISVFLFGLVACIEAERRPYYGDNYGPYDRADRYDVGTRINNQQRRIDEGIAAGDLTRREADILIDNLNWIRDEYTRATRDGRLTRSEIERLSEHLNQNNRMIMDKRNNEIRRVYSTPPPPPFVPAPAPLYEQPRKDFQDRIDNQQRRIDQGFAKGDLTRREADMLQDNLNYIRDEYSRMMADGRLTPQEADRLEQDLENNSRMIQDRRNNQIRRMHEPVPTPAPAPRHEKPRNDIRDRTDYPERREPQGNTPDERPRMDLREIRMENQQTRIDQAFAKGELTRREADIVHDNLRRIRAAYARLKAGGSIPVPELDRIDKRLDRNDNMIENKRHNAIERFD